MKKAVYITTAILAAAGTAFYIIQFINRINATDIFQQSRIVYQTVTLLLYTCPILALCVLSIIQSIKSVPRAILLLSSITAFNSLTPLFFNSLLYGLIMLAAGLLPSVYILVHYGLLVKGKPKHQEKFSGFLNAAGVISGLLVPVSIMAMITDARHYRALPEALISFLCNSIFIAISFICLTAFCFLKNRRTSVLYRMFFSGPSVYIVISIVTHDIIFLISSQNLLVFFSIWGTASFVLSAALVILLLMHTLKAQRGNILFFENDNLMR